MYQEKRPDPFLRFDEPRTQLGRFSVPIEEVALGSRVATRNPRAGDYDFEFAEPEQSTWSVVHLRIYRESGAVTDLELLRPNAYIQEHQLRPGANLALHIPELEFHGLGLVLGISPCPPIAVGAGEVVTGRSYNAFLDPIQICDVRDRFKKILGQNLTL